MLYLSDATLDRHQLRDLKNGKSSEFQKTSKGIPLEPIWNTDSVLSISFFNDHNLYF